MSGHNRWSKVKNVKGPADAKRGKLFTKLTKEIIIAARIGGGNLDGNARLRHAVELARDASMPKDNIERAIRKGTGDLQGEAIEEATYEGYGPGGVAILVETTSDNKNRTVSDLRNQFKSGGGNMGEAGSVSWMFTQHGQLLFDKKKYSMDTVMEVALEAGAQDISEVHDSVEVLTAVSEVYKVREAFEKVGMYPVSQSFTFVAKSTVPVEEKTSAEKILHLLESLEDHDDVQRVHANFEMTDALFSEVGQK